MREWMREKFMRRRSKRGPNDSESTGKIGQEIPTNQPAPLRPAYPEPLKAEEHAGVEAEPQPDVAAEMHGLQPGEAAYGAGEEAHAGELIDHSAEPVADATPR